MILRILSQLMLTPKQCRMACGGLGWKAKDLAENSGIRPATVSHFMNGGVAKTTTLEAIEKAFFDTGLVEFSSPDCVRVKDSDNLEEHPASEPKE